MQTVAQDPKSKEKKVIKFSLSQQTVEAFEDSTKVFKFDCVTGGRDHATDRGFFKVIRKPHFQY